jgi:gluconate 2-dehydrogenase alpha chain
MLSLIEGRLGRKVLPENHTLVDWPVGYDDLEPYYDRVEWDLGISGRGSNIIDGSGAADNLWEAPRARDYPMPPLRQGPADQRFSDACKRLGFHPFRTAAAIASEPFKGRSGCTYCGYCHGYPCHVNAKTSTHVALLPAGLASGNLEIMEFCRVYKVNRTSDGTRVIGVSYFDPQGRPQELKADRVVLACYALENARLMLASGINKSGEVGKHLTTHAFGFFMGLTPDSANPYMGPLVASTAIEDFSGELVTTTIPPCCGARRSSAGRATSSRSRSLTQCPLTRRVGGRGGETGCATITRASPRCIRKQRTFRPPRRMSTLIPIARISSVNLRCA